VQLSSYVYVHTIEFAIYYAMVGPHHDPIIVEPRHENPCADLLEIILFAPQGLSTEDFLLGAEARFGTMTIYLDDYEQHIEFGLSKATLRLNLSGCRVDSGGRLGEGRLTEKIKTNIKKKKHMESESQGQAEANLGANLSGRQTAASLVGTLSHRLAKHRVSSQTDETSFSIVDYPILALSGNRWLFSALGREVLLSKMAGDEPLCKVVLSSEVSKIVAELSFFPKHITIFDGETKGTRISEWFARSPSRAAVAKTLLAKQLRKLNVRRTDLPASGGETIIGARSILEILALKGR
jgi:hypothetical protein